MADGSTKPIEEVTEGDSVMAADPDRGITDIPCRVKGILHSKTQRLIAITLGSKSDGSEATIVKATGEHPFWVSGKGWIKAQNLQTGDVLVSLKGATAKVVRIETVRFAGWVKTYNLNITGVHAFFVLAGRNTHQAL